MPANQADVKDFLRRISRPDALEAAAAGESYSVEEGVDLSVSPVGRTVASAVAKTVADQPLLPIEQFFLEAIVIPGERPAIDVIGGDYHVVHSAWLHFNQDPIRQQVLRAISATGRVDLVGRPGLPFGGTAWVAGPGLLMTNRHVAELFASGLGRHRLQFQSGRGAKLDLKAERGGGAPTLLDVRGVVMIHPYWDMALLEVDGLPAAATPLSLSVRDPGDLSGLDVAVIGYPAFDPRNDAMVQNEVFGGIYNVKRLQPGRIGERDSLTSFGKTVSALTHDSSTLGGNSGSLVLDVQSGEVVALHFAGRYLKANYGVPAAELARDGRVVDAGVQFAGPTGSDPTPWDRYWTDTESPAAVVSSGDEPADARALTWTIPLEIQVRVGRDGGPSLQVAAPTPAAAVGTEAMVEPVHDGDLGSRSGYDDNFLGVEVPLPTPTDESLCAPVEGGGHVLHYHHFSIAMHHRRRLALFTASNIDMDAAVRQPEAGRDYTRRGLSGLGPNEQEKWFADPRIQPEHQLPDVFFNKDRQAFDKGHLVRREDVAWGKTYESLRAANGDTYHTTNCSPQVAGYNRSTSGDDNWGDLENEVVRQARTEKLSLFAGPVLAQDDPSFLGVDSAGAVAVQIPRAFWKVIVARTGAGLQGFGFLLQQDLSNVDFEFVVGDRWRRVMRPVADIETMLQVRFPQAVHDADQFDTPSGATLRASSGIDGPPAPQAPTTAFTGSETLDSLAANAHDSVRAALQGGRGLRHYLATIDKLTPEERTTIVEQATVVLEGYYSHLSLKKAMYGTDPIQRLRLLRRRLGRYESEISFHNELTDIFTGLRDLHTNYLLPDYFANSAAFLPFQIGYCKGASCYVVTKTMPGLPDPNFKPGVKINYWNAVPIDRAVEMAANYHAGSNPAARHARGVDGLTQRALVISAPPDDEWVIVGYTDENGTEREFRADWSVVDVPRSEDESTPSPEAAEAFGLDLEGDVRRRVNALLFAPQKVAEEQRIRSVRESQAATGQEESVEAATAIASAAAVEGLQTTLPTIFEVRTFDHLGKKIGYLRIRTFFVQRDEPFVNEIVRLLEHPELPTEGMVLDVRGNGGGLIWAGERLLQLFTDQHIEPTRAQFAVTPLTVELSKTDPRLAPWRPSLERAVETGAAFSAAFPITPPTRCNDIGRRYPGKVVLITDARCYSTTDMFAAGFQDHEIGKILGVDDNTGAGGANVWPMELLRNRLPDNAALRPLPRGADMRIAIRRTLRVGLQAGTEIEDLGVEPLVVHDLTLRDLLEKPRDADLLAAAAELLPKDG
ncbi:DNA/RNA non-specific endonuclease [Pseudonocardia charpentierae]|uniref:DNA/RNA non-specific endonuclease n=1 Tax=Pseudonocardia charpentierae TaxID=3075545 RepID=A0ABU2NK69_9PSEU|nr:DNA/RNA non-specific endonuclease [Pseudonocardia sp. DSM 45834]MDT0353609.1 DNA/RNA non-specific endonuclease [Pseudonocardia sp. DSM 45834]